MKPTEAKTYQQLKAELDDLMYELQQPDTDVDVAVAGHARGLKLIEQLEAYLQTAENKLISLPAKRD